MPASSKEFLDIQANIECGLTLNRVRDMIRTYNQLELIRFLGGFIGWKFKQERTNQRQ